MKIRIKGDTIRLRLTQSEVMTIASSGRVEEQTHFLGGKIWKYSLHVHDENKVVATLEDQEISVFLPKEIAYNWANTEEVGIEEQIPLENGTVLKILVEKDFNCLIAREGEDEDTFANPLQGK